MGWGTGTMWEFRFQELLCPLKYLTVVGSSKLYNGYLAVWPTGHDLQLDELEELLRGYRQEAGSKQVA